MGTEDLNLNTWLRNYYKNPNPDTVPKALDWFCHGGEPEYPLRKPGAMAFFSEVFTRNPDKLEAWFLELECQTDQAKIDICYALWWSRSGYCRNLLDILIAHEWLNSDPELADRFLKTNASFDDVETNDFVFMFFHWGLYFASGDEKYLARLMEIFELPDVSGLRFLEYCKKNGDNLRELLMPLLNHPLCLSDDSPTPVGDFDTTMGWLRENIPLGNVPGFEELRDRLKLNDEQIAQCALKFELSETLYNFAKEHPKIEGFLLAQERVATGRKKAHLQTILSYREDAQTVFNSELN